MWDRDRLSARLRLQGPRYICLVPMALLWAVAGLSAQATPPDPAIQKIIGQVSPDRIAATVKTLAGFETRGNYSNPNQKTRGIGAARRWIFGQFHSYSPRLEVSYDTAKQGSTDVISVIAVLPGAAEPEKRILAAAHYDSINLRVKGAQAAEAPAPGADDNASGTAVVLELARVMSQYRFRKTIVFIAFAGEEIGLVGSSNYASRARAAREQIEAVFNNDIVGANVLGVTHNIIDGSDDATGTPDGETGNRVRVYSPDSPASASRRLALVIQEAAARYVPALKIDLIPTADRFGRTGDQAPFQSNGFAAVRLTSASEDTASQHTANDLPEGVSPAFTAGVARIDGAAIATLASPLPSR
jgi:Zn-dependent M28 family amino/carboxypeptidase